MFSVYRGAKGFQVSSGVLENDFSGAAIMLPPRRCQLNPQYFDAQLTCYANFGEACDDFRKVKKYDSLTAVHNAVS